jgi:hypothetical protein
VGEVHLLVVAVVVVDLEKENLRLLPYIQHLQ